MNIARMKLMESIKIRQAVINDLTTIQTLNNKLFELEYANFDDTLKVDWPLGKIGTEYFTAIIENEAAIVAQIDDAIVGYLAGSFNNDVSYLNINYAEIDTFYIEPDYQSGGIGTMLINQFKDLCRSRGFKKLRLTASAKNSQARRFYAKKGFVEHEVIYQCDL